MSIISATMIARSHSVGEPRWSPSGRFVGWLDSWDSRTDLVIAPNDSGSAPIVVTADFPVTSTGAYGGGGWCWLSDTEVVVAGGDGRLAVLSASGGMLRIVFPLPGASEAVNGTVFAPTASADGERVAFCWERDDACDVFVVDAKGSGTGARQISHADYAWDPAWSADGSMLAWHEWDLSEMSWQSSRIALAPADGSGVTTIIDGAEGGVAVGQPRFSPDGESIAWVSDRSGWWNVWFASIDASGQASDARALREESNDHAAPSWGPGQRTFVWSPNSSTIAYERNENGHGRLVLASLGGSHTDEVAKAFHGGLDWYQDHVVAVRSGAKTPQQIVVYDLHRGDRRTIARGCVGGFEACGLVEPTMIEWDCDGETIHGLLRRPVGVAQPPLMVSVHGGPTDQAVGEWNPRAAYWVNRGWAVLHVNYRGSSGYGRPYRDALQEQWGVHDVQDCASGIRHVIAQSWCDPGRVVVTGGSAGGFTVLLMCALHTDLVTAGVSLFGVGDLGDLVATTHRFESKYLDGLVGVLADHADRYRDRSPITHASKVTVPMLLLQGRDDKVVPLAQSDAMVSAMRAAGADVEYQIYDGEGHGFRKLANVIDEYERTEAFLTRLGLHRP